MIKIAREDLVDTLQSDVVSLVFRKADGTIRTMKATLRSDIVPYNILKGSKRAQSETALPIFDVDLKQWRSVRFNSIMMIASF